MASNITPEERRSLAIAANVNEQYLYQCLSGRRDMNPGEARRIEDVTEGRLSRRDLCQKTWQSIWPELAGAEPTPDCTTASTLTLSDLDRREGERREANRHDASERREQARQRAQEA